MESYIVAQVPRPDAIIWSEWCYDVDTETIVRINPAMGEDTHTLPSNTIIFRISKYQSTENAATLEQTVHATGSR